MRARENGLRKNMEPMNIQEERANTKRERERADQAEEAQKLVEQYW